MRGLDAIDHEILNALSSNARISLKELSERVNLSSPAIAARIRRLERDSILLGYRAVLDHEKLGYAITALIHVAVSGEQHEQFLRYACAQPEVLSCDHITGAYSVLLRAVFHDKRALSAFVAQAQRYGKTQTQFVLASPCPAHAPNPMT